MAAMAESMPSPASLIEEPAGGTLAICGTPVATLTTMSLEEPDARLVEDGVTVQVLLAGAPVQLIAAVPETPGAEARTR